MSQLLDVIAVDGPAGAGKDAVCGRLVEMLPHMIHFNTGGLYRAIGKYFKDTFGLLVDQNTILSHLQGIDISVEKQEGKLHYFLNGKDVTSDLYDREVAPYATHVSKLNEVRTMVETYTRTFGTKYSMIVDGRDTTTVIFPDAPLKVYLDADLDIRTARRLLQLRLKGDRVSYDRLRTDMEARDRADREKEVGALMQAQDALYIDSSCMTIDDVAEHIFDKYVARQISS